MKAAIRKTQLGDGPHVGVADHKTGKGGRVPQRFALTNRTVARNLDEVEAAR